jgi:hypothetical protein
LLKPAAVSVVLVVVALAFVAGLLVGNNQSTASHAGASRVSRVSRPSVNVPNFGQTLELIRNTSVRSVTLDQQTSTMSIVLVSGKHYTTAYPNGYVSQIVNAVMKHEGGSALTVRRSS